MDTDYTIKCTGDVVIGDRIRFTEGVFAGSFRRPRYLGDRVICAEVVNDSYGAAAQQHTFTLRVIDSTGVQPLAPGATITRRGRNVYRNGTYRLPWEDESERDAAAEEKHARGAAARAARDMRKGLLIA